MSSIPPPFALFASLAADEAGAVAATFWRRGWSSRLPALTLLDIAAASIADLDGWLPRQAARLAGIARDLAPAPSPPRRLPRPQFLISLEDPSPAPVIFAPAAISSALIMRGIDCAPVPEKMELLDTAQRELKAAVIITGGGVHFAREAEAKVQRHPFNAVRHRPIDRPPSAVAAAFVLGVLLGAAPGF